MAAVWIRDLSHWHVSEGGEASADCLRHEGSRCFQDLEDNLNEFRQIMNREATCCVRLLRRMVTFRHRCSQT